MFSFIQILKEIQELSYKTRFQIDQLQANKGTGWWVYNLTSSESSTLGKTLSGKKKKSF